MIYCLGVEESYNRYFQEQKRPMKAGKDEAAGYPGGSVWRTEEEARTHCSEGYQVYGVLADWDIDTKPSKDGDWHDLLIDAELVQLEHYNVRYT
jgi:hypothetical protein